ncbi:MAG: proton-conducting transporter membrane subunit [Vallitaleaceae bacterium]|jgi:formate hydrogenlyase subunit 3/multisubunit Na+/H+ antiporter MnhD subunit|nr:proton-conducting transporter membrane subunit [Vallitaleaceae bacterium]
MTITMIVVGLMALSLVTYVVSKMSKGLGSVLTILGPLVALLFFLLEGSGIASGSSIGILQFGATKLGWFFSVTMLIVYGCVAFFNPYWMKKLVHPSAYNMLYILSLAGTIGMFFAVDFIVLFIFLEIAVFASMFIIPFGKSRNAAVVYFAMSTFGSFAFLYAIFMMYGKFGSFDISFVLGQLATEPTTAIWVIILMGIAAFVKLGIFPFHIWLPMAHGNAPDTFSPILSGGLVKIGAFIAIMVVAIAPTYEVLKNSYEVMGLPILIYIVLIIAAISMVVGTLMAIKQDDAKKLIAYSSVANAGYIIVGIALNDQLSLSGAMMHIFAHAIASAAAFLSIGAVSYRTGTTKISELGGMIQKMPITYTVYLISIISMAGIPPMAGFISKWLLFQSLASHGLMFIGAAAFFGSVGSFLYVFRPLSGLFLGQLKPQHNHVKEAPIFMVVPMVILSGISLFFGVLPNGLLNFIGKIQVELGVEGITTVDTAIMGNNGLLDPTLVFINFGLGFVKAFIIFMSLSKSRKVGLMDTYTAAEFVYDPNVYHYAKSYYAPIERLYEKHPDIVALYKGLVQRVVDLGRLLQFIFFKTKPGTTALFIVLTIILVLWGEKIW